MELPLYFGTTGKLIEMKEGIQTSLNASIENLDE